MDKVYIVQFDWSTTDASGIELYVYDSYDKAYDRFKQMICDEHNPDNSWVGDIEFNNEGYPVDERYDLDFKDNDSGETEVWWHIVDNNDWNMHSFIDLLIKGVM